MRKSDTDCRQIVRGDELDLVPHRLRLLLRLDLDVSAARTALRLLRLQRDAQGLELAVRSGRTAWYIV